MHQANVNIKPVDLTSSAGSDSLSPGEAVAGRIDTPYGVHLINRGEALDHAHMRSAQLASLLTLMYGEGLDRFRILARGTQDSLMWLAVQLAEESEDMLDIVASDLAGGGK